MFLYLKRVSSEQHIFSFFFLYIQKDDLCHLCKVFWHLMPFMTYLDLNILFWCFYCICTIYPLLPFSSISFTPFCIEFFLFHFTSLLAITACTAMDRSHTMHSDFSSVNLGSSHVLLVRQDRSKQRGSRGRVVVSLGARAHQRQKVWFFQQQQNVLTLEAPNSCSDHKYVYEIETERGGYLRDTQHG